MHIVLYVTVYLIMQIAFTGSSATGSKIMASAAQLVRVSHNANLLPRKSITLLWFGWHHLGNYLDCSRLRWNWEAKVLLLCSTMLILTRVSWSRIIHGFGFYFCYLVKHNFSCILSDFVTYCDMLKSVVVQLLNGPSLAVFGQMVKYAVQHLDFLCTWESIFQKIPREFQWLIIFGSNMLYCLLPRNIFKFSKCFFSKIIYQESIAAEFIDKLVKWSEKIKISDPFEEGCRLGPVISKGQVYWNLF